MSNNEVGNKLVAKVVSQKGTCAAGHKVGDEFFISDVTPDNKLCAWAFCALFPFAAALMYGGSFPWESDPNTSEVACPDGTNPVVFRLTCKA